MLEALQSPAKITLRSLAELCGVSSATASRALSGHPNVRPGVRERVPTLARERGYTRNQLVSALMAHVRSDRTSRFIGNLAIVHVPSPKQPKILLGGRAVRGLCEPAEIGADAIVGSASEGVRVAKRWKP